MSMMAAANTRSVHRRILAVALPAILANLTTVLPGLVDTAFIGQAASRRKLGGVAIGGTFCSLILCGPLASCGLAPPVSAQAYGAGDNKGDPRHPAGPQARLVLRFHPVAGDGARRTGPAALWRRRPAAPTSRPILPLPHVQRPLRPDGLRGSGLAAGPEPRIAFALQVLLNGLNVLFCYVAVLHYNMGVDGVAISTALAQAITAVAGLVVVRRIARGIEEPRNDGQLLDVEKLVELMSVNTDIFIRTLALTFIFTYFVHLSAGLDETTWRRTRSCLGFMAFIANALDGFAQSAETLTGQAIGAGSDRPAASAVVGSAIWALGLAMDCPATFWQVGPALLPCSTSISTFCRVAQVYLPWLIATPLCGCLPASCWTGLYRRHTGDVKSGTAC